MKTPNYGRMVGVGLGAGLAIAAVYGFTINSPPDGFHPAAGEFQSLSDWEPNSNTSTSGSRLLGDLTTIHPVSENALEILSAPASDLTNGDAELSKIEFDDANSTQHETVSAVEVPASNGLSPATTDFEIELFDDQQQPTIVANTGVQVPKPTAETNDSDVYDLGDWNTSGQVETQGALSLSESEQHSGNNNDNNVDSQSAAPLSQSGSVDPNEFAGNGWAKNPFLNGNQPPADTKKNRQIPLVEIPPMEEPTVSSTSPDSTTSNQGPEIVNRSSDFDVESTQHHGSSIAEFEHSISSPLQFANSPKSTGEETILPGIPSSISGQSVTPKQVDHSVAPLNLTLAEPVALRAAEHIEYGKTLARRGAATSAQQEFYAALGVIAQANDTQAGINEFSLALRRGILAMKEAEDFLVTDTETQIGLDVASTAETHRAGVLTEAEAQKLTAQEATQRYFAVAQEQLQRAGGCNVVTAEALYCLGKLHSIGSPSEPNAGRLDIAKAIVFHRAALSSDQQHARSANELGVLLARAGELEEAKSLFKSSLIVNSAPQTWENLAKLHYRLNEPGLAQLAQAEYQRATLRIANGSTQWMPPTQFNAEAPIDFHEVIAAKPKTAEATGQLPSGQPGPEVKSLSDRIKDLF